MYPKYIVEFVLLQSLCSIKSQQQQDYDTMFDLMSDESLL